MKPKNQIPKYKIETVKELAELAKNKKTILVASIKNIPASQFQEIGKKLRGKAIIKVPKKSLILRALESTDGENIENLKKNIKSDFAILFSDLDSFELALELKANKTPSKAKPGQEAPEDIEIPEGPTDLVPGPAVSELGALGIQIQIEKGKIHIKQAKVIAKQGEKISQKAADLMAKLDIKPFTIGFVPLCAFDAQENKFYAEIKIDREGTIKTLKESYAKSLGFAVSIGYPTGDTIKLLISKANAQERKLTRIMTGEPEPEQVVEEIPKEEVKEEPKEEKKESAAEGLGALFG